MDSENETCSSEDEVAIEFYTRDFPLLKIIPFNQAPVTHQLNKHRYYRYISPNKKQKGLQSFYGEDRSFCVGQIFDSCDFIIEFQFTKNTQLSRIPHHQQSYRGSLQPQEIQITGIYYLNPPLDYDNQEFIDHLKLIYHQAPTNTLFYEVQSYPNVSSAELNQISQKK